MNIQTPDGTTAYSRSQGTGTAWTTTVTAPDSQSSQTVIGFQEATNNFYETSRLVNQGSSTVLRTVDTCYNGDTNAPNCTSDAISLPILSKAIYTGLPGLSGKQALTKLAYNIYGLLLSEYDYDYGSGSPGPLLRSEAISYASLANIVNHPQTVSIYDGGGNLATQTSYTYDGGSVAATSGTPNHVATTGSRGNATTISQWVSSSRSLSSAYTYFDTGLIQTATGVNNGQTNYTYSACGNSFPTSITGATGLTVQETWNCNGGVPLTVTDANNNTVNTTYNDPYFWRPASNTDAAGNSTSYTYNGVSSVESVLNFNSGNSTSDTLATFDSLGRSLVTQNRQSPGSSSFDSVSYAYDSEGRLATASLPYTGSAGAPNPNGPGSTTVYDALNRKSSVSDSGGKVKSYTYNQNDKLVTLTPVPSGENAKKRQFEYDGLGRLSSVCEITSTLSGYGTCAQTNVASGYWTKYSYNALGKIAGVTQNAQSSGQQTRSYAYDGLGRLTSETNPETNNTAMTYVYDSDSTCGTSSGDLVKKIDAVGNVTCISYDALHRPTQITYPSGPYSANTPAKHFVYDSASVGGITISNAKGQLAEAYTGSSSSKITDLVFSYSVRGENTDVYESTPHSGGYLHTNTSFWTNGIPNTLSAALGPVSLLPTITYGLDGEGRPYSANASSGQNPLLNTAYDASSQVTALTYGSSDADAFGFDPNTDRPTGYQFQVNGNNVSGSLTWNPNGSPASLAINNPFNSADTQACSYSHDDLQRTASVNCSGTNPWAQTFSYDAFGNISKNGSISFSATYSSATNQISSGIPNLGYDANGSLTSINADYLHSYSWDADGNQTFVDGISVTFDALDRAVEQLASGAYTQILYATSGTKLALVSGGSLVKGFVPLPGNAAAVYNSGGLAYYRHPDWLGSSRFASTPSRTMYSSGSYAPFGESYSEAGTKDRSFTGQNQDTETGQYDFLYRNYSSVQGRWISPDRAGLSVAKPGNPQTWNRYAYVTNRPLKNTDNLGFGCDDDGTCIMDMDDGGGGGGGGNIPGFCSAQYSFTECGGFAGIYNGTFGDATGAISQECAGLTQRQCQILLEWDAQVAADAQAAADAQGVPCLAGAGPLAPGQSRCAPTNDSIFNHWPLNGNLWPGYAVQDGICSPPMPSSMNSNPGMLSCCQAHDACYTSHNCNASSWLPAIPGPCKMCNIEVVGCLAGAVF